MCHDNQGMSERFRARDGEFQGVLPPCLTLSESEDG